MSDSLVIDLPAEMTQASPMLGDAQRRRFKTGPPTNGVLRGCAESPSKSDLRITLGHRLSLQGQPLCSGVFRGGLSSCLFFPSQQGVVGRLVHPRLVRRSLTQAPLLTE